MIGVILTIESCGNRRDWERYETIQSRLSGAGYFYLKDPSAARLVYLWGRVERGLMSYDAYDNNHLRDLCLARKIAIPPGMQQTRKKPRDLIEKTDDDGTTFR